MPTVVYSNPAKGLKVVRDLPTPRVQSVDTWYRAAIKATAAPTWPICQEIVAENTIALMLQCPRTGAQCALVIDRTPA